MDVETAESDKHCMSLSSMLRVWVLVPHLQEFVVELCRSGSVSADATPYMAAGEHQV